MSGKYEQIEQEQQWQEWKSWQQRWANITKKIKEKTQRDDKVVQQIKEWQ